MALDLWVLTILMSFVSVGCDMCPQGLKLMAASSLASSDVIHMSSPTGSEYILTDGVLDVVVLIKGSCCRC